MAALPDMVDVADPVTAGSIDTLTPAITWALLLNHRHRIYKYLDTLLANQTAQKVLPLTFAKSCRIVDCPSYY